MILSEGAHSEPGRSQNVGASSQRRSWMLDLSSPLAIYFTGQQPSRRRLVQRRAEWRVLHPASEEHSFWGKDSTHPAPCSATEVMCTPRPSSRACLSTAASTSSSAVVLLLVAPPPPPPTSSSSPLPLLDSEDSSKGGATRDPSPLVASSDMLGGLPSLSA